MAADPHCEITGRTIRISIPAEIQVLFERQDNSGERLILWTLLHGFNALLGGRGLLPDLDDHTCSVILDTHAGIGPKKMLNVFEQDLGALLNPEYLGPPRLLQKHDVDKQLDGLARDL